LSIQDNRLRGQIPSELGILIELVDLNLKNNTLQGFPTEIGQLRNIEKINLSMNSLSSTIPTEIGNLDNLGA
jgi:Leucine-rich repeat (LRR) protein